MKFRYLILTIIIIAGLVYFLRPKNNENNNNSVKKTKEYQVFINENLDKIYETKIREWATENNQKININSNQSEAEIIIDKAQVQGYQSQEVGKTYSNQYENKGNYVFERKGESVFINFKNKKIESLASKFSPNTWNMFAVGDIMLSRHVGVKIRNSGNWSMPFSYLAQDIAKHDISIANLESPFNEAGQIYDTGMTFGADPKTVKGLNDSGFDIIALANNHFGNMQNAGMSYTMNLLNQNKIKYAGAGETIATACEAKYIKIKNQTIAFLDVDGVDSTPMVYRADSKYPGLCSWQETTRINNAIKNAKAKADFIIMSMHAGTEYKPLHRQDQEDFAHKMIDSGINLVIGTHPHVAQDVETYKNGLIFYSLGNFIFDQMWSEETKQGLTVELNFDNNQITSYKIKPVLINTNYQPNWAPESVSKEIMERIGVK